MIYADIIKEIRRVRILSQEDLAHELGVSFATVNRWEGNRTQPSQMAQRSIEKFCKRHNIQYLLDGGDCSANT